MFILINISIIEKINLIDAFKHFSKEIKRLN